MEQLRMDVNVAKDFVRRAFIGYGFPEEDSAIAADVLTTADLYGIQSHGIHRLMRYADAVREGSIDPKAEVKTIFETPLSAVWDAYRTLGQPVAYRGMETAIRKAKEHGFGSHPILFFHCQIRIEPSVQRKSMGDSRVLVWIIQPPEMLTFF